MKSKRRNKVEEFERVVTWAEEPDYFIMKCFFVLWFFFWLVTAWIIISGIFLEASSTMLGRMWFMIIGWVVINTLLTLIKGVNESRGKGRKEIYRRVK